MTETSELLLYGIVNKNDPKDSAVDYAQMHYFYLKNGTLDAVFETYQKQMIELQRNTNLSFPERIERYTTCSKRFKSCIAWNQKYQTRDNWGKAGSIIDAILKFVFGRLDWQGKIEQRLKDFHKAEKIPLLNLRYPANRRKSTLFT